uniref:SusD/RagB family nutrient-binding outer membrane lipoprotein n=1 Tax=Heterorhabditis bacteriophora TaxID=37862 RepID=A0A1I7XJR5_HETBA
MGYLTSEQALADYATLITELKLGGAWAASAPLLYFSGSNVDPGSFDSITTNVFDDAACNRSYMASSWTAIKNLVASSKGQDFLNEQFRIDPKSLINSTQGGDNLIAYLREAIEYMAMVNYPYPTEFLKPLPAWPVNVNIPSI